ncbi:MAG: ATP-binding protein [Terriglobia bacterium]
MAKVSKVWLKAVAAAGVLTLIFALLALVLYNRTEAKVVRRHSQDQELVVRLAAVAFAHRVDTHRHRVEAIVAALHLAPEEQWERVLRVLPGVPSGSNLLLLRPDGRVHFREPPRNAAAIKAAVLRWRGAREAVLTNPIPPEAADREVVVLVPVLSEGGEFAQVGLTVPFAPLLETLFPRASAPVPLSLALLDDDGNVLAHTRHPEMVGRRIPAPRGTCLPCHTSFALERRMQEGEAGVEQLQVGREPLALVAFTPVKVLGRRWSLSLSEPYEAIIADTRRGFRAITMLLGFALLVGIVAISITHQYGLKRRRAEERARLAERQAALERQMRHAQQLAALGKMTSQVAHQINTPLATLGLNVSYLQAEVARRLGATGPEVEEVSNAIAAEIDRLKRVVNDYLRFSRAPQPVLELQSLRALLETFADFVEPEARERGVRLEIDLGPDPAYVRLDGDLFRQAFLNLVRNSFEAMPDGGRLRIRLTRADGEHVVRVEDSGRGVPADILPRIFDPFFTTKKDGTGLGLVHSARVVEEHGGSIRCESTPGQGTTFTVRLPAAPAPTGTPAEFTLAEKGR